MSKKKGKHITQLNPLASLAKHKCDYLSRLALTGLAKYDKQYWGIDKLSTFTAYRIHEDEELSALFREAGCGSLLDAKNLQVIAAEYTPDQDTSTLRKYLGNH